MKIGNKVVYENLNRLFKESETIPLENSQKWVIFSDLHVGDGGSTDDFKNNSEMFISALRNFYHKKGYGLILNGDVEELQRFSLKKITSKWPKLYEVLELFSKENKFYKTIGNHDLELEFKEKVPFKEFLREGIKLKYKDDYIFIFHGHQASKKFQKHNQLIGFTLKYFANPLGIKNYSVAHSSRKQYNIEKRVYHYSSYNKIASIIGHTHRPLFESLHKVERLKYKVEQLCREFSFHNKDEARIGETIKLLKKDIRKYYKENKDHNFQSYVYNTAFHIPCVFNSGCVIGKRGMTCIEIEDGNISLVHWFDEKISKKYLIQTGYDSMLLTNTDYYRMVLNKETLDYIFTRIKFLS
ncbi:MAG: metallophosphoesterase [Bacteroidota bacterium]